ncbi:MAG: Butyryl-CoA dehydrogenase, partial [Nocardioidaceae bacterium]|nr:Butyryl-CoA dehydrogenase [Nocardioidaceae bacterium]
SFVVFVLDVPGVEIRPMAQLHGNAGFAEVFFTDVRIPLANVVGKLNDGWNVAATSLILERGTGRGNHTKIMHSLDGLIATVAERRPNDTAALERLGSLRAWAFAYEQATYASIDSVVRGAPDNGGSSVIKLRWSEIQTAIYEEQLATFGDEAEVVSESGPNGEFVGWQRNYWHSRAGEIYAGTNEVQRNIIAERMLGLPREVRP